MHDNTPHVNPFLKLPSNDSIDSIITFTNLPEAVTEENSRTVTTETNHSTNPSATSKNISQAPKMRHVQLRGKRKRK